MKDTLKRVTQQEEKIMSNCDPSLVEGVEAEDQERVFLERFDLPAEVLELECEEL